MEIYLPKELCNIVDEYSKDTTNYDNVVLMFKKLIDKMYVGRCFVAMANNDPFSKLCGVIDPSWEWCLKNRRSETYFGCIHTFKLAQIEKVPFNKLI